MTDTIESLRHWATEMHRTTSVFEDASDGSTYAAQIIDGNRAIADTLAKGADEIESLRAELNHAAVTIANLTVALSGTTQHCPECEARAREAVPSEAEIEAACSGLQQAIHGFISHAIELSPLESRGCPTPEWRNAVDGLHAARDITIGIMRRAPSTSADVNGELLRKMEAENEKLRFARDEAESKLLRVLGEREVANGEQDGGAQIRRLPNEPKAVHLLRRSTKPSPPSNLPRRTTMQRDQNKRLSDSELSAFANGWGSPAIESAARELISTVSVACPKCGAPAWVTCRDHTRSKSSWWYWFAPRAHRHRIEAAIRAARAGGAK